MGGELEDRRDFLRQMGSWALGVIVGSAATRSARAEQLWEAGPFPRPIVPGACIESASQTEATLAAILDTVVPGSASDPAGDPGALEACAMNLMVDDAYPFRAYAELIATLMDEVGQTLYGKPFVQLSYAERLAVLQDAVDALPLLNLAYRAIRSTFYGGAYNGVGLTYVGYPGPNLGYRHLQEFSFRTPLCKELTSEGWMP